MMRNKFEINNHIWEIELRPESELLEEYQKRINGTAYGCFGLTFYKEHKIWIAKELCIDERLRTLRHELTHCYIWESGLYHCDYNDEEIVCDIVANSYTFINKIMEDKYALEILLVRDEE